MGVFFYVWDMMKPGRRVLGCDAVGWPHESPICVGKSSTEAQGFLELMQKFRRKEILILRPSHKHTD